MKISEVVSKLEETKEKFGDIEVTIFDPDELADGTLIEIPACMTISEGEDGNVNAIVFVDEESLFAFSGSESENAEG